MEPQVIKFWIDVLHSPVAIALSSGIAGSLITLIVTWLKLKHDEKENRKAWERQEESRKEERLFELKVKAYEEFADCFVGIFNKDWEVFNKRIVQASIRVSNYGAPNVKVANKLFFDNLNKMNEISSDEEKKKLLGEIIKSGNKLHEEIIVDIMNMHPVSKA